MENIPFQIEDNTSKIIKKRKSQIINKYVEFFSISLWLYLIVKNFLFDIDIYFLEKFLPEYVGILDYKFVFIICILAFVLALTRKKIFIVWATYIILYPLIFLFWKVPFFIFKQKSWVLAIALINSIISSLISFKRAFIISVLYILSAIFIFSFHNKFLLYSATIVVLLTLIFIYGYRFIMIFKSSKVNNFYIALLSKVGENENRYSHLVLDAGMKNLSYQQMNEKQLDKWVTNLQNTVLFNRFSLFMAKKLKNYQDSKWNLAYYAFTIFGLIVLTILSFSLINLAVYKIDVSSFKYSDTPSFFTFFYYSFNNLLFNGVDELKPLSIISQSVSMIESFLSLFMGMIFVSLLFSAKSERHTRELDVIISEFEAQGSDLESFMKKEYKINSIEDAMEELQKVQAISIKLLYKITESIK